MGILKQTKYLLRKNYLIKRRNLRETLQEVLVPIWWVVLLLVIGLSIPKQKLAPVRDSDIPTFKVSALAPSSSGREGFIVGYVINDIQNARRVIENMNNFSGKVSYLEFNDTDGMLDYYRKYSESTGFEMGIEFGKGKSDKMAYTLHVGKKSASIPNPEERLTGQGQCRDTNSPTLGSCAANSYIFAHVTAIQASIDAAITMVEASLPSYVVPNIQAKMMPKESFTQSFTGFAITASIYMVLAFTPYIVILLINLVLEKEKKLKDLMRIMGMSDIAYWFSWCVTYGVVLLVASLILNAILVPAGRLGGSNYALMVILFFLYGLSIIMLAFFLSPFFKVAKTAGVVVSILSPVLGCIAIPLIGADVADPAKWGVSLFSPTAFALLVSQAVDDEGLQFNNLTTKGNFPPINYVVMLIVDIILYFFLALYLDNVIPTQYGRRRSPYFIFLPSFWKSLFNGKKKEGLNRQMSAREQETSEDIETVHADMHGNEAISIHRLRKVFHGKEKIVAVDGVSMDIYEGQVTALLGHNGAGKSTLIAMITGVAPASGGYATVYGLDITDPNQMQEIRKLIGVCPQDNVLFDFLTVKEHLEFYCGLKGIEGEEADTKVTQLLKDTDLTEQKDTLSMNLSGGQKRKLCVGVALVGNPKVVILDEPTSGMDPYSRRLMWSLLQEKAKDRVVLLTTHFMDEADILADYKAILSKGKVRCAGSSLFLKNRFGIGYHLNMALADDCDTDCLTDLVQSKVQGAEVIRHHGKEMAFSLPMEQLSTFPDLLKALEDHNDSADVCAAPLLGVTSYGVSMTTLEEVFLQLEDTSDETSESVDENEPIQDAREATGQLLTPSDVLTVQDGTSRVSGSVNALNTGGVELNKPELRHNSRAPSQKEKQQLLGLLKIRWLMTARSPSKIIFMVIIPPILLIVGLALLLKTKDNSKTSSLPDPLHLSPNLYLKPGSQETYATDALVQNATGHLIDYILGYLTDYEVGTDLVSSIGSVLNSSSHALYNLAFSIRQFPTAFNLSNSSLAGLSSSFFMRYNDTTVHSVPVGVNILGSILHMNALKSQNLTPYPLEANILPFPGLKPQWSYDGTSFTSILLIGLGLALIPGGFAIEVVALRQEKMRHLLRVSGVSSIIYWLQFFLFDAVVFLIPCVLMLILIPAFQLPSLSPAPAMGSLVLCILLYFPSGILFSYLCSFMFGKWETAQQIMPQLFLYGGLVPWLTVALIDMISSRDVAIILHSIFVFLLPPYPVFGALYYIDAAYRWQSILAAYANRGIAVDVHMTASHYFKWTKHNGIPIAMIAPVVHIILFSVLIYYLDQRNIGVETKCFCKRSSNQNVVDRFPSLKRFNSLGETETQDEDVKREKEKLMHITSSSHESSSFSVFVKGLWKRFGSGKTAKTVVKDLYFGVEQGEVFGLLGPNGAGKTTSLSMITADFPPTRGKVYVAGYDISKNPLEAFQCMGYCPQKDALWPTVTLEEHLTLFARIRGVPWDEVKTLVNHYMSALRITEHAKKKAQDLSGGTKRKVSFGNAMLGDPQLLLLDEPSSGMDPSARRFLWNTISKNVQGTRGAILTTHSMEEADALCSRVGIMVKGRLKCLGSTQHLKSTYGSGYTLEIKLKQTQSPEPSTVDPMERLHSFVSELLPGATESESFGGRVVYKVPKEGVGVLSIIFHKLEKGKEEIGIEEYSFSQSTLEQVFLEFAREQDDDRTGAQDKTEDDEIQNGEAHVSV